jgi:hypothetical protein
MDMHDSGKPAYPGMVERYGLGMENAATEQMKKAAFRETT